MPPLACSEYRLDSGCTPNYLVNRRGAQLKRDLQVKGEQSVTLKRRIPSCKRYELVSSIVQLHLVRVNGKKLIGTALTVRFIWNFS